VDTGSGFKDDKLRSEDFFDVKKDLYITAREKSREQWPFDRKEFGMDSGIPFIRIADRVEVTVDFKVKRVSGSPLLLKQ